MRASAETPADPFPLPLTPYERYWWRNHRPAYPSMFSVWVALRGQVDRRLLDAALNETVAWHPLLRAAIVGRGRRARWTSTATELRVEWPAGGSRAPVDPPDVSRGVCLRVVGGTRPDGVDLAFHFHHACCDGVGGMEFLGDLFASYSQLASGRSRADPVRRLDPEALRDRTAGERVWPVRRLAARVAAGLAFRPVALAAEPGSGGDLDALFRLPEVRLDEEETQALRRLAHGADASLNDLLIAEVMLAVARWNAGRGGGNRIRLLMPTDMRTPAHADAPAANIVGYEPLDRTLDAAAKPDELVASVRDQTAAVKKARRETWLDEFVSMLASRPVLLDALFALPTSLYTGVVSNLGDPANRTWAHLARPDGTVSVGAAVVEGVGAAPPVRRRSCLAVAITDYAGNLSITGRACPATIGAAGLERFLDLLGEQLRARARDTRATVQPAASAASPPVRGSA